MLKFNVTTNAAQDEIALILAARNHAARVARNAQDLQFTQSRSAGNDFDSLKIMARKVYVERRALILKSRLLRGLDTQNGARKADVKFTGKKIRIKFSSFRNEQRVYDSLVHILPRCFNRLGVKVNRTSITVYQHNVSITSFRKLAKLIKTRFDAVKISTKYNYSSVAERVQIAKSLNLGSGYVNIGGELFRM